MRVSISCERIFGDSSQSTLKDGYSLYRPLQLPLHDCRIQMVQSHRLALANIFNSVKPQSAHIDNIIETSRTFLDNYYPHMAYKYVLATLNLKVLPVPIHLTADDPRRIVRYSSFVPSMFHCVLQPVSCCEPPSIAESSPMMATGW